MPGSLDTAARLQGLGHGLRSGFGTDDPASAWPAAPAAPAALPALAPVGCVLHLSDTRFGDEDPQVLEALVALALRERPQVVVATGDITHNADSAEFAAAARFFARLACRHQLVVPGNHDLPLWNLPLRLLAPYTPFRQAFGDELEPRLQAPGLWVAGLCSTRRWRHHKGTLSRAQVLASAHWLAQAPPGALRVVALHHTVALQPPPAPAGAADDSASGAPRHSAGGALLHNAAHATAAWAEAGVHLVLSGPGHQPGFVALTQPASGPADAAQRRHAPMWAVPAGIAVSRQPRCRGPQAVNLLRRVGATDWRVEGWTHAPEAGAFVLRDWLSITTAALAV